MKRFLPLLALFVLFLPHQVHAAPAYQSIQTATVLAPSSTCTVTKPVSLAVGDLMVAAMAGLGGTNTTPTGWTVIRNQGSNSVITTTYWKIANSADVSAANFSFVNSANQGGLCWIARFTGTDQTNPIDQNNGVEQTGLGTTVTSAGITPTSANSYFVEVPSNFRDGALVNSSGYAIVTDNPTWTETADFGANVFSTFRIQLGMAYGSRPQTTASGNASYSTSANTDNAKLQIFNIVPPAAAPLFNPYYFWDY